jgi:D-arabinose 1-dehydrogenase-like Zn-dependent alcohol dehydrogenase
MTFRLPTLLPSVSTNYQNLDLTLTYPYPSFLSVCAGVTVYKAIKESNAQGGEWIVIPGAGGGLGHLAVQYAHYLGLRVIGIDTGDEKKALVKKLGADVWIDFKQEKDIVKAVQNSTPDGLGPHAAIVAAAGATAYETALEYVRPHGTVVAVGLPPGKIQADIFWTVLTSKRLVGSYVGNRQDADEALRITATGQSRVRSSSFFLKTLLNLLFVPYFRESQDAVQGRAARQTPSSLR